MRIDFGRQGWVLPSGFVGLSCLIEAARQRGQSVTCDLEGCQNASYWARMGFCELFDVVVMPEGGARRAARSRFSELQRISELEEPCCTAVLAHIVQSLADDVIVNPPCFSGQGCDLHETLRDRIDLLYVAILPERASGSL